MVLSRRTDGKDRHSPTDCFTGGPSPIANMNFNDLIPTYENGNLVGWTCSRCAWSHKRDVRLADIDALAIARAEFFSHTCGLPEVAPGCGKAQGRRPPGDDASTV